MSEASDYKPPRVWRWEAENGGTWAKINRPVSGATFEAELPRGEHPLQLYSLGTPNGQKVTIALEELLAAGHQGAQYDAFYIDIGAGEQFSSGFVALNPNSKIPALLDTTTGSRVFESGAILLYLAEAFGELLPRDAAARTEALNWLFWLQGAAPYLGGGFGHFYHYAPVKIEYAIDRFAMETKRQLDVLDKRLAQSEYLGGDTYSIADIATWPWYGNLVRGRAYEAGEFLQVEEYHHVRRWSDQLLQRPALQRGRLVNWTGREGGPGVRERHSDDDIVLPERS